MFTAEGLSAGAVMALAGFVLVLIGCGAGYWWYSNVQAERARQQAQAAAQAAQAQMPKSEEVYAQAFAKVFSSQPRYPAAALMIYAYGRIRSREMNLGGWQFTKIECDSSKGECAELFKRDALAARIPLAREQYDRVDYGIDTVAAYKKIDLKPAVLPVPVTFATLKSLFNGDFFDAQVLPTLQLARDLEQSSDVQATTTILGLPPSPLDLEMRQGSWSLAGSMGLFDIVGRLPSTCIANNVRIEMQSGGLQFSVSGVYWKLSKKEKALVPAQAAPVPPQNAPTPAVQPGQVGPK